MATRKVKTPRERQSKALSVGKSVKTQSGPADHAAAPAIPAAPTVEEIRVRAYQLYLERGGTHGQDLEDWLAAERQLREPRATSS
jgi:Protein of unknown function (DUF2934)